MFSLLFMVSACAGRGPVYKHISPLETMKLCFIGDTGNDSSEQKRVALLLENEKCNSIHFVGDIVYDEGIKSADDEEFRTKFFNYYYKLSEKDFHPRLYIILGNHDHQGSVSAWEEVSKKNRNIIFPNPWYLVKISDLCIAHLDTEYYKMFHRIPTGYSQKSWMRSLEKTELKDCAKKIALTHHPYKSRGENHGPSKGLLKSFHEDMIIGKYDFLISGHEHILSDEGVKKGTRMLISGAGGGSNKKEDIGFLILEWNRTKKEISYYFRKLAK